MSIIEEGGGPWTSRRARESVRRSASNLPRTRTKIPAAQYSSSGYLCLHLDQFISNFNADFRFEPDADQVERRLGAYAGTNPRVTCDCFGNSERLHGV